MEIVIIVLCSILGGGSLIYLFVYLQGLKKDKSTKTKELRLKKIKNRDYLKVQPRKKKETKKAHDDEVLIGETTYRFALIGKLLEKLGLVHSLNAKLKSAGITTTVDVFVMLLLIVLGLFFVVGTILLPGKIIGGFVFAILGLGFPFLMLKVKTAKREDIFTGQLPDALGVLTSSLRAGHSLTAGMLLVASEFDDPISGLFRRVVEEINLGKNAKSAFSEMCHSMPGSVDLRFFVTAVLIQREVGGNLAEILDSLNATIRERLKFFSQLKAQTAQAKLSGIILGLAPVGVGGIIYLLNPDYMKPLITNPIGQMAIGAAVFMTILGFVVIKKITNIQV